MKSPLMQALKYALILITSIYIILSIPLILFNPNVFSILKYLNELGLITLLGIVVSFFIVLFIYFSELDDKNKRYIKNQEEILKNTLLEIFFLTKKNIKLEENMFGGHIKYFKDALGKSGVPHHDMRLLTENSKLDYTIKNNKTDKVKQLIFHANDKINLLNNYRREKGFFNDSNKKEYIQEVIKELENILTDLKNLINRQFRVFINE